MIKTLTFLLVSTTFFLSSCTETPFVPNSTNELLVGQWNIDQVDNSDALVSATEMVHSILNEKFTTTHLLNFNKGATFTLLSPQSEVAFNGEYAIGLENKSLSLKIDGVVYEYDLINQEQNNKGMQSYAINSKTPGETVKLMVSKK